MDSKFNIKGRGTAENPANRFEKSEYVPDPEDLGDNHKPSTIFYRDDSRSIITYNESPDVGFSASINPYRGCEHGCVYCYARPTHEYLGLSPGLDFETRIFVKENASGLLRKELSSKFWTPQPLAISGVTDCYQPAEKKFEITRKCLEVLSEFRNPVGIVTKNRLVTRDTDILKDMSSYNAAMVAVSITTLDPELCRLMEPRTAQPEPRLHTIYQLARENIPVMVLIAPVIPGLNDHEIPKIIRRAVDSGASAAGYVMLRLPHSVKDLFALWLERNYSERKNKILSRIKSVRKGKMNNTEFHSRMSGNGIFAKQVKKIFDLSCRKAGIENNSIELCTKHFRKPSGAQLELF